MKYATSLLCAATLAVSMSFPAHAAVEEQSTNLISSTPYLFSYRHQRHMVVTADGRYHLLANLGTQGGANASLYLLSSDDGVTWAQQRHLGYTDQFAVSDSALVGNTLTTVYQGSDGFIRYATATYDPTSKSWGSFAVSKVTRAGDSIRAMNPSFTVDANGSTWVAYVEENTANSTAGIVVYRRLAGKSNWESVGYGQPFSGISTYSDPQYAKRSARLVNIPSGIGMIYTMGPDIFWAQRKLKGPADLTWNSSGLFLSGTQDKDPMSSHFSAATDSVGNVFVAFTDNGNLYYNRREAANSQWLTEPLILVSADNPKSGQPTYAQVSLLGNGQMLIAHNAGMSMRVLKAPTTAVLKTDFKCQLLAYHNNLDPAAYYKDARLEMPAFLGSATLVPLLQQYQGYQPVDGGPTPPQYAGEVTFSPTAAPSCQ